MTGGGILLVDDEPAIRRVTAKQLASLGVPIECAETGSLALESVRRLTPRVVVLDVGLPDMTGLDVLAQLLEARPTLPVIMLTGHDDAATAVRALRAGAFDYLTKPVDAEELVLAVERAFEHTELLGEVTDLRDEVRSTFLVGKMGPSEAVAKLAERINQVASSSMSVLVLGETGSGKELVAEAIHRASPRRSQQLVTVDCGAIPDSLLESEMFGHEEGAFTGASRKKKGQFELAHGGTLFLDEVGNLSQANQAKLLRVLEARKLRPLGGARILDVDVRIVAATNEDLEQRVRANAFRQDLYYRLAEFTIRLPALRERASDIPYLARRFRDEAARELHRPPRDLTADALELLRGYEWPGNVRELRNVVRQAMVAGKGPSISSDDFVMPPRRRRPEAPRDEGAAVPFGSLKDIADTATAFAERGAIERALAATDGRRVEAARLLQIDVKTLFRKMKRYAMG